MSGFGLSNLEKVTEVSSADLENVSDGKKPDDLLSAFQDLLKGNDRSFDRAKPESPVVLPDGTRIDLPRIEKPASENYASVFNLQAFVRGAFFSNSTFTFLGFEVKTDDSGQIYSVNGKLKPQSTYTIEGHTYETDDNGVVYRIDGKLLPDKTYTHDGHTYKTDDNGEIYCRDGENAQNHSYKLDGHWYRTDDNGHPYLCDGKPSPNDTYQIDGHTFRTDENGQLVEFDGQAVDELSDNDFNELQKAQIKEGVSRIDQGEELSKDEKGNLGEMMMDQYYISQGYTPLNIHRVNSLYDNKSGYHTGIDGVYERETPSGEKEYLIADAKYGKSQLGDTKDGKQMSDNWIEHRLDDAVGKEKADEIRDSYETNPDSVQRNVYHIDNYADEGGNTHTDTQQVDSNGNKVGTKTDAESYNRNGERNSSANDAQTIKGEQP